MHTGSQNVPVEEIIKDLREQMDQWLSREYAEDEDVPDEIIEAYVAKIKIYKDHMDWYLRLKPFDQPEASQHDEEMKDAPGLVASDIGMNFSLSKQLASREYAAERDERTYSKVFSRLFTVEDAKKYRYADSSKRRVLSWKDVTMNVYV